MDELIQEFLVETHENLDRLDRAMVELEKNPGDKPSLDSVFRTIHTLKGTCGFVSFTRLAELAHVGENLLARIREGSLRLDEKRTSALLTMADAVRAALGVIEETGLEPAVTYEEQIEQLTRLTTETSEPDVTEIPEPVATPTPSDSPAPTVPEIAPEVPAAKSSAIAESTIRVDVAVLDQLMNLVGELVLARNQILQCASGKTDTILQNACQRLNLITSDIQATFMRTRMQPIENVFGKFPRIIRDLAAELGKSVRLETFGRETELDRKLIEAIRDPLTHLIRNSVDHGLEAPEVRVAAGKPAEGVVTLRATHEGGQVHLEIADDGAGIDAEKVKQKAISRGLLAPEQASRMEPRDAFHLIFLPGLSTAEQITNVSGRGVGMDVVQTNIAQIGGSVEVHSEPGKGTTIHIHIPLTLAIIPALIVTANGERIAIPQAALLELIHLDSSRPGEGIELIDGKPVYRLRGELLPLLSLAAELQLPGTERPAEMINIVVLRADGGSFGLLVDEVSNTEEIVVKALGRHLKPIELFAGATIMGDGRVALILDVAKLARKAGLRFDAKPAPVSVPSVTKRDSSLQTLLLFDNGKDGRVAIPLSLVARLEEFRSKSVEHTSDRAVMQYRGGILPLVPLNDAMRHTLDTRSPEDSLHVVVYSEQDRRIGLVVGQIRDIVEEPISVPNEPNRQRVLANAIVEDRVTELIDLPALIRDLDPDLFDTAAPSGIGYA